MLTAASMPRTVVDLHAEISQGCAQLHAASLLAALPVLSLLQLEFRASQCFRQRFQLRQSTQQLSAHLLNLLLQLPPHHLDLPLCLS